MYGVAGNKATPYYPNTQESNLVYCSFLPRYYREPATNTNQFTLPIHCNILTPVLPLTSDLATSIPIQD